MPTHDENGEELTGQRAKYAGMPIAGGRRHLLVQCVADWGFLKVAFDLDDTHYNTDRIRCCAVQQISCSCLRVGLLLHTGLVSHYDGPICLVDSSCWQCLVFTRRLSLVGHPHRPDACHLLGGVPFAQWSYHLGIDVGGAVGSRATPMERSTWSSTSDGHTGFQAMVQRTQFGA